MKYWSGFAARNACWIVGTWIEPGMKDLLVGIAYVVDSSVLGDSRLDFSKCRYVAIGTASESLGG